jgi:CRISPR system Cascade subunit CasE
MYLSQIELNLRNAQVRAELANRYDFHRTLLRAFPETLQKNERILFRMETRQQTAFRLPVLVQSQIKPDWLHFEQKGLAAKPVQTKKFVPQFVEGQKLIFRLLANPTKRRKPSGKRVGVYEKEDQYHWIEKKLNAGGAELIFVTIEKQGIVASVKYSETKKYKMQHYGAYFDGQLKINDIERFDNMLRKGIGTAKAFGFGLLSVALSN